MGLLITVVNRLAQGSTLPRTVLHAAQADESSESTTTQVSGADSEFTDYKAASKVGFGITGQNSYPVAPDTDPELWEWNKKTYNAAKEEGLDPFDVVYWVCRQDLLLQAAARGGFPRNISHWKNGMDFYQMSVGHQYKLQRIFEMIINNDPSHAYLMAGNELVDQKLVMSHCMGHSDFFKNNIWFRDTSRNMLNRIAEHEANQRKILDEQGVPKIDMEKFLEKAYSIDHLIDTTNTSPRQLSYELLQTKEATKVPEDHGVIHADDMPSHMQRRLNDSGRLEEERGKEQERLEKENRRIPKHPDADVLGFIIENSTVLKPWQRQMLMYIREQSYYMAPQGLTKIMNEGWAVYWHNKLMSRPDIKDLRHATSFGDHNSGTLAMSGQRLNPYTVGYAIFLDIKDRWDKGQHGREWEEIEDLNERLDYDIKEMKGKEKIFEVIKWDRDVEFIRKYFTPEIAVRLKMYTWDQEDEDSPAVISGRKFEDIKSRLIDMIDNGGQPRIVVTDGNHDDKGELLLQHKWAYDLKKDYAHAVLKNLLSMWGRPVHLDTQFKHEGENTPIRITVENTTMFSSSFIKTTYRKLNKTTVDGEEKWIPSSDTLHETKEEIKD